MKYKPRNFSTVPYNNAFDIIWSKKGEIEDRESIMLRGNQNDVKRKQTLYYGDVMLRGSGKPTYIFFFCFCSWMVGFLRFLGFPWFVAYVTNSEYHYVGLDILCYQNVWQSLFCSLMHLLFPLLSRLFVVLSGAFIDVMSERSSHK